MKKLTIWEKERLIQKIAMCREYYRKQGNADMDFPLEDILLEFYKHASVGIDVYSLEHLSERMEEYRLEHAEFDCSLEDLTEGGWISVLMGRWENALDDGRVLEGEALEQYPDGEILAFLAWLKKEEPKRFLSVEVHDPEKVLKKWREVYPNVWEISDFDKKYLFCIEGKYYAGSGYMWDEHVDRALAKLWMIYREEQFQRWLDIARGVKGTGRILEFLDDESAASLLECLCSACLYPYDVPSWRAMDRYYGRTRMLENRKYAREPEEYGCFGTWSGNRVFDANWYSQHAFETLVRKPVHEYDFHLVLTGIIQYFRLLSDEEAYRVGPYLNAFDQIGGCTFGRSMSAENIYELLTNGNTMFLGFRTLAAELPKDRPEELVMEIMEAILEAGSKTCGFLQAEEIGSCLLYLMEREMRHGGRKGNMLLRFVELTGREDCFKEIAEGMCGYFAGLLELKEDVKWTRGFHLLLLCMDRWFYQDTKLQALPAFGKMRNLLWNGFRAIFDGSHKYAVYLHREYFTPPICYDLYRNYIVPRKSSVKRKMLLPMEQIHDTDSQNLITYQYRLLLVFLYHIRSQQEKEDVAVKSALLEALENVLLDDSPIFDYSKIQIFSTEEVLQQCIGMLSCKDETEKRLMEEMLKSNVPELLIYYHAAKDEWFQEKLLLEISQKASEDSLNVFEDDRAVDLVILHRIECLYPAVRKRLNHKLDVWEKRGVKNSAFAERARHQLCWLQYEMGQYEEILSGENTFFQAVIYMDAEPYKDFWKADRLWINLLRKRGEKKYACSVFLNYLLLLNRELADTSDSDTEHISYLRRQTGWITDIIEREEIEKWSRKDQEEYCQLIVWNRKLQGMDYLQSLYDYKGKYQISLTAKDFLEEEKEEPDVSVVSERMDYTEEDMVNVLSRFFSMDQKPRSRVYYKSRGIRADRDMEQVLLVDKLLGACAALQHYGPQLVFEKTVEKECGMEEKQRKLYENYVTQLLREIFNLAYGEWYDMTIHDQQEMGTTGRMAGGRKSPAQIDLVTYRCRRACEIVEAFVLEETTPKKVFKDHVGKALGNNICREPLSFLILYGNAKDNEKAFSRYRNYLENEFLKSAEAADIAGTEFPELRKAPYYMEEIMEKYHGFRFIRQKITFSSGREQEILHIFVDIAKEEEGKIRWMLGKGSGM